MMAKHKIIIVGGGFAGLSVAKGLSAHADRLEVTLIDPRTAQHFLPLLPDMVGRGFSPENLCYPYASAAKRWRFSFLNEKVEVLEPACRQVSTSSQTLNYDFLVIASGCRTNFFGNDAIAGEAHELHSVDHAAAILQAVQNNKYANFVVCGGGYTGVEIATHLWRLQKKNGGMAPVHIVERAPVICAGLPEKFQIFIADNVSKLGINMLTSSGVEGYEGGTVNLSGGDKIDGSMLIWTAGVCGQDYVGGLGAGLDRGQRVIVNDRLMISDNVFVAGDAANFNWQGKPLRMGIQFSLKEGECVAANIMRMIRGKSPQEFVPHDPGYVVPMANGLSCGNVMGRDFYGRLPFFLHYMMSVFRSFGLDNRIGLIKEIFFS